MGIAEGLCYLHNGVGEKVVHGDLKGVRFLITKRRVVDWILVGQRIDIRRGPSTPD